MSSNEEVEDGVWVVRYVSIMLVIPVEEVVGLRRRERGSGAAVEERTFLDHFSRVERR